MRTLPYAETVKYWYLTVLALLANTLIVVWLLTMVDSSIPTVPFSLTASLFSYVILVRGLIEKRGQPRRVVQLLKTAGTAVGTALGVAVMLAGCLIGSSWVTLWLVTEFG